MEHYLNRGIKDIIQEFPETGRILNGFNIGCTACNVGTCLLKDIVEVHNLTFEDEHALMLQIGRVIYPGIEIAVPRIERKVPVGDGVIRYSPPMRALVDEHTVIKRLLALIPRVTEDLNVTRPDDRKLILEAVDFIRSYADRFHHAKEEEILFREFGDDLEILKSMLEEHRMGRGYVKSVLEAVEKGDTASVSEHLTAYGRLLQGHIKKEDEILYPWMDRDLSVAKVGELFARFAKTDEQFHDTVITQKDFVRRLEEKFSHEEVTSNA